MSRTTIVQVAALAAAVTAAVLLAGTNPDSDGRVGGPCDQPGQVVVDDGRQLTCTTTLMDRQPRWRTGQLDLPAR